MKSEKLILRENFVAFVQQPIKEIVYITKKFGGGGDWEYGGVVEAEEGVSGLRIEKRLVRGKTWSGREGAGRSKGRCVKSGCCRSHTGYRWKWRNDYL